MRVIYYTHMGIAHQEAQKIRWANTGAEERARLGSLHAVAAKRYWATVDPEVRKARAQKAAGIRWAKIRAADV